MLLICVLRHDLMALRDNDCKHHRPPFSFSRISARTPVGSPSDLIFHMTASRASVPIVFHLFSNSLGDTYSLPGGGGGLVCPSLSRMAWNSSWASRPAWVMGDSSLGGMAISHSSPKHLASGTPLPVRSSCSCPPVSPLPRSQASQARSGEAARSGSRGHGSDHHRQQRPCLSRPARTPPPSASSPRSGP